MKIKTIKNNSKYNFNDSSELNIYLDLFKSNRKLIRKYKTNFNNKKQYNLISKYQYRLNYKNIE